MRHEIPHLSRTICSHAAPPPFFPSYAIIAVGVVLVYSLGTWVLPGKAGARNWFKGPHLESLSMEEALDGGPGASMHGAKELPQPIGV